MKSLSIATAGTPTIEKRHVQESPGAIADPEFGTNVPGAFLVSLDLLALCFAFVAAFLVAPYARPAVLRWLRSGWVVVLAPDTTTGLRPIQDYGWLLFVMATFVVLGMQATAAYRPLTRQSR